jgi:gluconolactonase
VSPRSTHHPSILIVGTLLASACGSTPAVPTDSRAPTTVPVALDAAATVGDAPAPDAVAADLGAHDTAGPGDVQRPPTPAPPGLGPVGSPCVPGAQYGDPLPPGAHATTIRSGFREAEGPVWVPAQKALYLSDIDENNLGNGSLQRYTPATGQWDVIAMKVGPNGLALDLDGRIVAACHDVPGLYRFDPLSGMRTLIAGSDRFEGKPFNEPNDVVVRTDGNLYFTDPKVQPGAKGRAGQGVTAYYRVSPAGAVTRIAVAGQPNGIALSPDGRFLYVTGEFGLRRHEVAADGSVSADSVALNPAGGDGMGVDCAGNLYLTANNGVLVLSADGKPLGNVTVPSSGFITNVAFGGDDRQTLFVTTRYAVHQLRVAIPGFPN